VAAAAAIGMLHGSVAKAGCPNNGNGITSSGGVITAPFRANNGHLLGTLSLNPGQNTWSFTSRNMTTNGGYIRNWTPNPQLQTGWLSNYGVIGRGVYQGLPAYGGPAQIYTNGQWFNGYLGNHPPFNQ
jgi:hypothetical protein